MNKKGIIWDFGGVVTSSPFENFNKFEATHGLPTGFIRLLMLIIQILTRGPY